MLNTGCNTQQERQYYTVVIPPLARQGRCRYKVKGHAVTDKPDF